MLKQKKQIPKSLVPKVEKPKPEDKFKEKIIVLKEKIQCIKQKRKLVNEDKKKKKKLKI